MKTTPSNKIRKWSIISGLSLLVMALTAGYAYGFVFSGIYVENNAVQTLSNIQQNYLLYLSGAAAWCLILITDLLVSYGFYIYLRPVHKTLALASGMLRLIYSLFLAVGILYLFKSNTDLFLKYWSLGLFIIGFHLIATGLGTFKSPSVPTILGILLIVAGSGYTLIHGLENFIPNQNALASSLESILAVPMTIGELSFGIWLLVKGGKHPNLQPSNAHGQDAV